MLSDEHAALERQSETERDRERRRKTVRDRERALDNFESDRRTDIWLHCEGSCELLSFRMQEKVSGMIISTKSLKIMLGQYQ